VRRESPRLAPEVAIRNLTEQPELTGEWPVAIPNFHLTFLGGGNNCDAGGDEVRFYAVSRIFTFPLLICGLSQAQAVFEVVPSAIGGIELIPAGDKAAGDLLRELPQASSPFAQVSIPYSVVVRNTGSRNVIHYTILFRCVGNSRLGGTAANVGLMGTERKLAPGQFDLVAPTGIVSESGPGSPIDPVTGRGIAGSPANFERLDLVSKSQRVVATLDSVIYDNGQLVGPDTWGTFDDLTAGQRGLDRFFGEVQGMTSASDREMLSRLEQIMEDIRKQTWYPELTNQRARADTLFTAGRLFACLKQFGNRQRCTDLARETAPKQAMNIFR
jgi:hypothetical protein